MTHDLGDSVELCSTYRTPRGADVLLDCVGLTSVHTNAFLLASTFVSASAFTVNAVRVSIVDYWPLDPEPVPLHSPLAWASFSTSGAAWSGAFAHRSAVRISTMPLPLLPSLPPSSLPGVRLSGSIWRKQTPGRNYVPNVTPSARPLRGQSESISCRQNMNS